MKKIEQSETRTIKRSEIVLNPFNPKVHSEVEVKRQLANFKSKGNLGGIVWNERSGRLISGHKRTLALDMYYKYDGTAEKDYDIKVEVADYDDKEEKEQMVFMSGINDTAPDYNLIANIIDDIDYKESGISEEDYNAISQLKEVTDRDLETFGEIDFMEEEFLPKPKKEEKREPVFELPRTEKTSEEILQEHEEKPKMSKEEVKERKRNCEKTNDAYMDKVERYIILNFADQEEKLMFCEALGLQCKDNMVVSGKEILELLDC